MKVLVTGSEGFIGSHLTELLVEKGFDVKAFVRYNFKNDWGWLENSKYKKDIEVYTGDIRDYDSVYDAMKGVDVVFHLAALIGIPYSYISPLAYIKTNTEGTYNVLEAGKKLNIKRIIHTSTSEIYGTAQYVPIDEKHPYNPQSPYAASKAGADHMALAYFRSFETPVTIIRPFNTYGPRQSARAIIPTIISQILAGKKQIKLGNLTPTRDLNYVKDTVNGFITVGMHEKTIGDVYNLGTGKEISIGDLAQTIIKLIGKEVETTIDKARTKGTEIQFLPNIAEETLKSIPLEMIDKFKDYCEVFFSRTYLSRMNKILDLIFSSFLLIMFSPVILFSIMFIYIKDRNPVFSSKSDMV